MSDECHVGSVLLYVRDVWLDQHTCVRGISCYINTLVSNGYNVASIHLCQRDIMFGQHTCAGLMTD